MKPVKPIAQAVQRVIDQAQSTGLCNKSTTAQLDNHSAPRTPLADSLLDLVCVRMATRYGHAWTSQYAADPAAADMLYSEWGETLSGLSRIQIARGFRLDADRADNWPPSSPLFAAMCLGVPSVERVKAEVRKPAEGRNQPFMRLLWSFIDSYTFARATTGQADRMIADAFVVARENVLSKNAMPEDVAGVIEQRAPEPRVPASEQTAREHLRRMRAVLRDEEKAAE